MSINKLIQDFTRSMRNEGYNVEVVISKAKKEAPQIKVGDFVKAWNDPDFPMYGVVTNILAKDFIKVSDCYYFQNFELSKEPA